MEINDGEITLVCNTLSYGFDRYRGNIAVNFDKTPEELKILYVNGEYIDKLIIYDEEIEKSKKYAPVFLKVKIDFISGEEGYYSVITMKSLRYVCALNKVIKYCLEPGCGYKIDYPLAMTGLLTMGIEENIAKRIWESSHIDFFCCSHYYKVWEPEIKKKGS